VSAADLAKANLKVSRANFERIIGHSPEGLSDPSLHIKGMPHTVDEAVAAAEQESPQLAGALYREEVARHEVDRVYGGLLPEVHLEASYGQHQETGVQVNAENDAVVAGRVTMPLYDGGSVQAQVRQAKHIHVSRLQEIEQARTETQAAVRVAWSKLMAARAQMKSDEIQVDSDRIALDGVREEEKVGQRTLLDVLNAEQELLDAQLSVLNDRHDLVVDSYALLAPIGKLTADKLALDQPIYDPQENYFEAREKWFGLAVTHADGRLELLDAHDAERPRDPVE
jgi:outer membrane protein